MLGDEISIVIVGNKTDLENKRVISEFSLETVDAISSYTKENCQN